MFSKIFSRLLAERGVSTYRLTKDVGISNGMISKWQNGLATPSAENLIKLADYFGVSVDFLLGRVTGQQNSDIEASRGEKDDIEDEFSARGVMKMFNRDSRIEGDTSFRLEVEAEKNGHSMSNSYTAHEPAECPICHVRASPIFRQSYNYEKGRDMIYAVLFECTGCHLPYIACYELHYPNARLAYCGPKIPNTHTFEQKLIEVSPRFQKTYNEASYAHEIGLKEIAGAGYRRALEILIRDFLEHNEPGSIDKYKDTTLRNCINHHLPREFDNLITIANNCALLGNDETHYCRIYQEQDVDDLKILLDSSYKLIEAILLAEDTHREMGLNTAEKADSSKQSAGQAG